METVYSYAQKQAVEDGILLEAEAIAAVGGVDCPTPREAGIVHPVLITSNLFDKYINPSEEARKWGQSLNGRLWDVYYMFSLAARNCQDSMLTFKVIFQDGPRRQDKHEPTLWAICDGGDDGKPVITLMLPEDY
jgi:hypothetical protein